MGIREEMPLLARHEGQWCGTYTVVDASGAIVDRHRSLLTCRLPADEPARYDQTNVYEWDDGRREELHFPAEYRDGRIWFDTDRIQGSAWEADERTILLHWQRKDLPGSQLYEMIQLSPDGRHRARTWHWFRDGVLVQRTLIQEERVN
jgi:hypothetical protein